MKKTKITSLIMALVLVLTLTAALFTVAASADGVTVYVTVSNGTLMLTSRAVSVTDVDGDGALTINDALVLAHDAAYEGGSAAGYASATGTYGLAITKLWGVENGGSYGYYIQIDHGGGLETLYAHCSSICVTTGQQVQAGEVIGYVGHTGRVTGNHLHLEVRIDGNRADVLRYFTL